MTSTNYTFDQHARYFAVIDDKTNSVLVYDSSVNTDIDVPSTPLRTITDETPSSKFTCLSIFATPKSKSVQIVIVYVGTNYGDILMYNVLEGKLEKRMTGAHSGCKVVSIVVGSTEKEVYSVDLDGRLCQWQADKPTTVQAEEARGIASVAVSKKGNVLATGSTFVRVWDATQMASLRKHKMTKTVDNLSFSASLLIAGSSQDQYINVFDTESGSNVNKNVLQTIRVSSGVRALTTHSSVAKQSIIAAVTDNKSIEIIHINPTTVVDTTLVTIENQQQISLISCQFISANDLIVVHANKDNLKKSLKFEIIKFRNKEGYIRYLPVNQTTQQQPTQQQNGKTKKENNVIVNTRKETIVAMGDAPIETVSEPVDRATAVIDQSQKSASTVVDLVVQGITSNDKILLAKALAVRQDVITNTVKALPSPYAYTLLKKIITELASDIKNSHILLVWVTCIIKFHTSYLLSVPDLRTQLSVLNGVVEDKYQLHQSMNRLVGKFELVESQKNSGLTSTTIDYDPTLVYEDNSDESEESDMEDDDEDEDDEDNEEDMEDLEDDLIDGLDDDDLMMEDD